MQARKVPKSFIIIILLVGVVLAYILAHFGYALDHTSDSTNKIEAIFNSVEKNLTNPLILKNDILTPGSATQKLPLIGLAIYGMWGLTYIARNNKLYRKGVEHGSARWATTKEAKMLLDDKGPDHAIVLTNDVFLGLNTRQTLRNLNVLVIGGSGSGKTRFYVKPNIMQSNTSFVITDPKGELLRSTGKMLEQHGYEVKVFNLINMKHSFNYNPFAYLTDENGNFSDANVIKMINVLMKNTKKEGHSGGDQFWEDSTEALLLALAFYLVYEGDENEKNFGMMMELIHLAEAREDQENYQSPLDILFADLEKQDPHHPAVKYYNIFKKAAGKTAKSILISTAVRLKAFNNRDVVALTSTDNLNFAEIGEKKTALFVVIPDSDDTFNFIVAMLYTQMFDVLYRTADFKYGGHLPVHVRFLLDEFANIGQIPNFDKLIATMRSREISVNPIIQNIAQLKKMYKDSWESIVGNCDSMVFLGGKEPGSLDFIAKALGKQTIDTINQNVSRSGKGKSTSLNEGILGRELMTSDEISRMPTDMCICLVRGMYPFYSKKYIIDRHKNYKYLSDANPDQVYDISHIRTKDADTELIEKNDNLNEVIESVDVDDEVAEEIHKILNFSEEGGEDTVTSVIDVPSNDSNSEDAMILNEDTEPLFEADKENHDERGETDTTYVFEDLVIEENDEFSDLNQDDEYIISIHDEVILDEEEKDDKE